MLSRSGAISVENLSNLQTYIHRIYCGFLLLHYNNHSMIGCLPSCAISIFLANYVPKIVSSDRQDIHCLVNAIM